MNHNRQGTLPIHTHNWRVARQVTLRNQLVKNPKALQTLMVKGFDKDVETNYSNFVLRKVIKELRERLTLLEDELNELRDVISTMEI